MVLDFLHRSCFNLVVICRQKSQMTLIFRMCSLHFILKAAMYEILIAENLMEAQCSLISFLYFFDFRILSGPMYC